MRRRSVWPLILLLSPLLLGWSDPEHDLAPCRGGPVTVHGAPIDMVKAVGTSAENGQAIRFQVTFSRPLPVPDRHGRPLRVDVLLRDPSVPDLTAGPYLYLNRIVRFDAVAGSSLVIMLLPERSATPFAGGVDVRGDTLTMVFPARMVMPDPDLAGFDLRRLRWTVVARDGSTCDLLGGRSTPNRRLMIAGEPPGPVPAASPGATPTVEGAPPISTGLLLACAVAIGVGGAAGWAASRWRRRPG